MKILITEDQFKNVLDLVKEDSMPLGLFGDWKKYFTEKELNKFDKLWSVIRRGVVMVPEVSPYKFRYKLNGGYRIILDKSRDDDSGKITKTYVFIFESNPDEPKWDLYGIDGETETKLAGSGVDRQIKINDMQKILIIVEKHIHRTLKPFGVYYSIK
jgi:hypothetical protein